MHHLSLISYIKVLFQSLGIKFYNPAHMRCNANIPLYPDPTDSIPCDGVYKEQEGFEESLRFCVVRNPFDWLTSYYFHTHGEEKAPWLGVKGVGGIRYFYSTFEKFVEAYCDGEQYWNIGLNEFRRFYPFQIFDEHGTCQSHLILKNGNNEELQSACTLLAMSFGIPYSSLEKKLNTKTNTSSAKKEDYRKYYTSKMIDRLEVKWENILSAFGYDFNGSTDEKFMISGKNVRYSNRKNLVGKKFV